ncbi:MAG: hypothetical protein R3190_02585 [Thermoanaerobaculia bacterium]|nr:hypothetical protein [Thermoanaerobaculia bacterium]
MFSSLTALEVLLAVGVFLLAAFELWGVLRARRSGRSDNLSRVITHGVMLLILAVYSIVAISYYPLESSSASIESYNTPVFNWTFVLLGVLLTLIATWEGVALARARREGLTNNLSRLVTHSVMVVMLLAMMGLSVQKWDHYLDRLEASYSQDIRIMTVAG